MSVLKFKPVECYIYTDEKGNRFWWKKEFSDEEMFQCGYDCVGFRRNGVDECYEPVEIVSEKAKSFERKRSDIDLFNPGVFNGNWRLI